MPKISIKLKEVDSMLIDIDNLLSVFPTGENGCILDVTKNGIWSKDCYRYLIEMHNHIDTSMLPTWLTANYVLIDLEKIQKLYQVKKDIMSLFPNKH